MSGTRIKLCGLTRPEDIEAANTLRPDYVGFVFAPSRRRLDPDRAAALRRLLDPAIPAVGVFVNEKPERVAALAADGVIDLVQLHGDEDDGYIRALRALCPLPVIKAVGVGERVPALPTEADYLLFDARMDTADTARGGNGRCFDWSLVEGLREKPFFLGGGLGPDNAAQAVERLRPFAVDASSLLETDGAKDPRKMRAFVNAVRRLDP